MRNKMYVIDENIDNSLLVGSLIMGDKIFNIYWVEAHHKCKLAFFNIGALLKYLEKTIDNK